MPGSPNCARARDTARFVDAADPLLIITVEAVVTLRGELDRSVEDDVTRRVAVAVEAADRIEVDARDVSFLAPRASAPSSCRSSTRATAA